MATIDELIAAHEVEVEAAEHRARKSRRERELILEQANKDGRPNLNADEEARFAELTAAYDTTQTEIRGAKDKLAKALQIKADEDEAVRAAAETHKTDAVRPAYDRVARVGSEERTYNPQTDRTGQQFLTDVANQFLHGDIQASERLARHMHEERVERGQYLQRTVGTGAFTGLTVPQYLTDMYAPLARNLRPFADACNKHVLPEKGMTVEISRITTGSTVAEQATQGSAVSETNMDDTLLSPAVITAAGVQGVSRQAIERGTGISDVVMDDLFRAHATTLDNELLNRATVGLTTVTGNSATYTEATSTGLYPKILEATSLAEAAFLAQARPDMVVMHSRRWHWLSSQLVTSWPFIHQPGLDPRVAGENAGARYGSGVRGMLPNGMLVVVDNNIVTNAGSGTNEDIVYVVASDECHLWEDPQAPIMLRAEQTLVKELSVVFVVYSFFAFTFRRYGDTAHQRITGVGLETPAFA
jgi:hypothetical protein